MWFGRLPSILAGLELYVPLSACQGRAAYVVMSGNGNSPETSRLLNAVYADAHDVANRM
jgi:hypothetical protein